MSERGTYVYAIARGLEPTDVADGRGIHDQPLGLVEHRGLVAVVGQVDLDEFGEEGLRRNLEDLRWLESVATAHDRVARLVAERAPTTPLRLATVFLTEERLRDRLDEWHDAAERALDRVEGRSEWSVKGYADPDAVSDQAEDEPVPDGLGAGRAYLLKRRAATRRQEQVVRELAETAERMHESLASVSVAGRRLPAQDRRLTGHTGEMVLNGTYLVENYRAADFREAVESLPESLGGQSVRVRVELAGPWPPYSFASLEEQ